MPIRFGLRQIEVLRQEESPAPLRFQQRGAQSCAPCHALAGARAKGRV